jgi:hypothetical protein
LERCQSSPQASAARRGDRKTDMHDIMLCAVRQKMEGAEAV